MVTITKRVSRIGNATGIYLDKYLGFKPGDIITVTIETAPEDAVPESRHGPMPVSKKGCGCFCGGECGCSRQN